MTQNSKLDLGQVWGQIPGRKKFLLNRAPGLRSQTNIVTMLKCVVGRLLEVMVGVCVLLVESLLLLVTGGQA